MNIPNLKLLPNRSSIEHSQIVFPIIVLPEDDRTDAFQEKPQDLPCWTMIWAVCVSINVSKYPDILTSDFFK